MGRFAPALIVAASLAAVLVAQSSDTFKLGRFSQGGRTFLGVVVDDKTVVEIPAMTDMKTLIADYAKHRTMLRDMAAQARAGKTGRDIKTMIRWRRSRIR